MFVSVASMSNVDLVEGQLGTLHLCLASLTRQKMYTRTADIMCGNNSSNHVD